MVIANRKDLEHDEQLGGSESIICHFHVTKRSGALVEDEKNAKALKEKITWDYLIQKFNENYVPELQGQTGFRVLELKQGQMIVTQYDTNLYNYPDMQKI